MKMVHLKMSTAFLVAAIGMCIPAQAAVVLEYDASTGLLPSDAPFNWVAGGNKAATNPGAVLQINNAPSEFREFSAPATAGLMQQGVTDYAVEFRVQPLSDMGASDWYANMKVTWSDDGATARHDISIDKDSDDAGPGTTGGIRYGQSFESALPEAITGIDWSTPHTIFIGYDGSADDLTFYLDGVFQTTIAGATVRGQPGNHAAQDAVRIGDGTNQAASSPNGSNSEWYFVRLHDTNVIPEPASLALVGVGGLLMALRRRR